MICGYVRFGSGVYQRGGAANVDGHAWVGLVGKARCREARFLGER